MSQPNESRGRRENSHDASSFSLLLDGIQYDDSYNSELDSMTGNRSSRMRRSSSSRSTTTHDNSTTLAIPATDRITISQLTSVQQQNPPSPLSPIRDENDVMDNASSAATLLPFSSLSPQFHSTYRWLSPPLPSLVTELRSNYMTTTSSTPNGDFDTSANNTALARTSASVASLGAIMRTARMMEESKMPNSSNNNSPTVNTDDYTAENDTRDHANAHDFLFPHIPVLSSSGWLDDQSSLPLDIIHTAIIDHDERLNREVEELFGSYFGDDDCCGA